MTNTIKAIVRGIPDSFTNCLTTQNNVDAIDVNKARLQHKAYLDTLKKLGLDLIYIEADENLPDCCFTEDTAIVLDELAIIFVLAERPINNLLSL